MTQSQAADIAKQMALVADALLRQLEGKVKTKAATDRFFLGALVRSKTILREAGGVLERSESHHLDPAFILFRALLDDAIRVFAVYGVRDREKLIVQMNAQAVSQIHVSFEESAAVNHRVHDGKGKGLLSSKELRIWKEQLASDTRYAELFENRQTLKFRRMPKTSELLEMIEDSSYRETVAHAHVIYLRLSQHVHYSPINFFAGRNQDHLQSIIGQLEECLIYAYKSIRMAFEYFTDFFSLTWSFPETDGWFGSVTHSSKPHT